MIKCRPNGALKQVCGAISDSQKRSKDEFNRKIMLKLGGG